MILFEVCTQCQRLYSILNNLYILQNLNLEVGDSGLWHNEPLLWHSIVAWPEKQEDACWKFIIQTQFLFIYNVIDVLLLWKQYIHAKMHPERYFWFKHWQLKYVNIYFLSEHITSNNRCLASNIGVYKSFQRHKWLKTKMHTVTDTLFRHSFSCSFTKCDSLYSECWL